MSLISRQALIDAFESLDLIDRQAATKSLVRPRVHDVYDSYWMGRNDQYDADVSALKGLPSAEPAWNNHTVACLLAELFDDACACNYNDIDEWLPEKCELLDSCPNPGGVACWEQFLKHKAGRKTDE